ncbi:MAG: sigma-70 family RNA polymerase sigma factor [Myxococcota bacterium]|nr:sigma-70 family RNA polymerase sigma factor [Myxococcota bacterium]
MLQQKSTLWDPSSEKPTWHHDYRQFKKQIGPDIPVIRATARRILGDDEAAADAVQDALIALWQHGPVPDHQRRWLIRTVVHRSLHARRSRMRRHRWEDLGGDFVKPCSFCDPARQIEIRELLDVLEQALESLPPDQRRVVELRDIEGLDYREIADQLGIPVGTVRSRLNRARNRMRESNDWLALQSL